MPNHVLNVLRISGPDKDNLLDFMNSEDNPFDFDRVLPCPEILLSRLLPFRPQGEETPEEAEALQEELKRKYGSPNWYHWRIGHWGTKWNSYGHFYPAKFDIGFCTAWSPPSPVYAALTQRFDARITAVDHDEGDAFCTESDYENGACLFSRDLDRQEEQRLEELRSLWI